MIKIFSDVWNKLKMHIIYILIILLLACFLCGAVNRCSNVSREYKHNIEALNDTIKCYQDKNGNLVATKLAFESDVKTLKDLNRNLYDQIDSLKLRPNNVSQIIQVGGEIENPNQDTAYVVLHDTISKGFYKDFNFNNKYRTLEGNVNYQNDSLGIHITKDVIQFDYTIAMDKDARMYIKSTNPYVKYKEMTGFTVPQKKHQKTTLVIGPSVTWGYDINSKKTGFTLGVSATYGLNLIKSK